MSKKYSYSCRQIAQKAEISPSTVYARVGELVKLDLAVRKRGWHFDEDAVNYLIRSSHGPISRVVASVIQQLGVALNEEELIKITRKARSDSRKPVANNRCQKSM